MNQYQGVNLIPECFLMKVAHNTLDRAWCQHHIADRPADLLSYCLLRRLPSELMHRSFVDEVFPPLIEQVILDSICLCEFWNLLRGNISGNISTRKKFQTHDFRKARIDNLNIHNRSL